MKIKKNYYVIYGRHAVFSVLKNRTREIYEILISKDKYNPYLKDIPTDLRNLITKTTDKDLDSMCKAEDKHQGIAIKVSEYIFKTTLNDFIKKSEEKKNSCIFIMDEVQDPHNFGAIIRNSYAFDIDAIVIPNANSCSISSGVVRSSAGYSEEIKILKVSNINDAIIKLKENNFWIIGLDSHADESNSIDKIFQKYEKTAFILGSEGFGIKESHKKACDFNIKIPMSQKVESLNVSNAAAIIAYECFKNKY